MRKRRSPASGFTLLEALVVVAIMGIIVTLGFPAIQMFIHRSKIEGIARSTGLLMKEARFEAIKRGVPVIVRADQVEPVIIAFADVDGDLTFLPDPANPDTRASDYEIRRYRLPAGVTFDAPGAQAKVFGFTALPALPWNGAVYETNGSIRDLGAIRFGDQRGNYLEVRVEPEATARVSLRKWDGASWWAQGEGDKTWEWL
jgi:prepilin-type N-terminal cleavage/methylation domain-containing protein